MARQIIWSSPSVGDLSELHTWNDQLSPPLAKQFLQNLRKTVESFRENPRLGRLAPELEDLTVRELLVGDHCPCWMFYRVGPKERIEILRLRRASR